MFVADLSRTLSQTSRHVKMVCVLDFPLGKVSTKVGVMEFGLYTVFIAMQRWGKQEELRSAYKDVGFAYFIIMRRFCDTDPEMQHKYFDSGQSFSFSLSVFLCFSVCFLSLNFISSEFRSG